MNAVEFVGVVKNYGDKRAVAGVSLEVPVGSFVVMMGASGSGKTTLLKMVNRLITPSSGRVLFFGEDSSLLDVTELRRKVGYVLQSAALFPHWTVKRNIAAVPEVLGWERERINERVHELLELMGLPPADFLNRYPSQLSGGEQQRVGIARAMAGYPSLLLMDEPFGALDVITRARLQDDIIDIQRREGITIIFVTHDLDEAFRLGDRVAIMNAGELVQYDTPLAVIKNPATDYVRQLLGFLSAEAVRRAGLSDSGRLSPQTDEGSLDEPTGLLAKLSLTDQGEDIKRAMHDSKSSGHVNRCDDKNG